MVSWDTATDWDAGTDDGTEHAPSRDSEKLRLGQADGSMTHFWRFNSLAGDSVVDRSGGYDLSNPNISGGWNSTAAPSPRWDGCLRLDGTYHIGKSNNLFVTSSNVWEFEAWFRPEATGRQGIMGQYRAWNVQYDRYGNQGINIATWGGNHTMGSGLATGTWHHIYAFWDRPNNQIGGRVNGTPYSASYSDGVDTDTYEFVIGATNQSNDGNPMYLNGYIAEARVSLGGSRQITDAVDLRITQGTHTTSKQTL